MEGKSETRCPLLKDKDSRFTWEALRDKESWFIPETLERRKRHLGLKDLRAWRQEDFSHNGCQPDPQLANPEGLLT